MSAWTVRAIAVGEMCPFARITSATIARRWGVIRRPRLRSSASRSGWVTVEATGASIVAKPCRCKSAEFRPVEGCRGVARPTGARCEPARVGDRGRAAPRGSPAARRAPRSTPRGARRSLEGPVCQAEGSPRAPARPPPRGSGATPPCRGVGYRGTRGSRRPGASVRPGRTGCRSGHRDAAWPTRRSARTPTPPRAPADAPSATPQSTSPSRGTARGPPSRRANRPDRTAGSPRRVVSSGSSHAARPASREPRQRPRHPMVVAIVRRRGPRWRGPVLRHRRPTRAVAAGTASPRGRRTRGARRGTTRRCSRSQRSSRTPMNRPSARPRTCAWRGRRALAPPAIGRASPRGHGARARRRPGEVPRSGAAYRASIASPAWCSRDRDGDRSLGSPGARDRAGARAARRGSRHRAAPGGRGRAPRAWGQGGRAGGHGAGRPDRHPRSRPHARAPDRRGEPARRRGDPPSEPRLRARGGERGERSTGAKDRPAVRPRRLRRCRPSVPAGEGARGRSGRPERSGARGAPLRSRLRARGAVVHRDRRGRGARVRRGRRRAAARAAVRRRRGGRGRGDRRSPRPRRPHLAPGGTGRRHRRRARVDPRRRVAHGAPPPGRCGGAPHGRSRDPGVTRCRRAVRARYAAADARRRRRGGRARSHADHARRRPARHRGPGGRDPLIRCARMPELVRLDVDEGVGIVRLDRPPANAISLELSRELLEVLREAEVRDDVGALVLWGGPTVFAAGADIKGMVDAGPGEIREQVTTLGAACDRLEAIPKISIAAINGYALGGGFELALACDLRYAASDATVGQPEIRIGVIPGAGGTQRIVWLAGLGVARDLTYTGRRVPAEEARALGLVERVVPPEDLLDTVVADAKAFVRGPRRALAAAKEATLHAAREPGSSGLGLERELFLSLFEGADQREGMQAFLEKRPPEFRGD